MELNPVGGGKQTSDRLKSLVCEGIHQCATQNAGSFLAPREAADAVAHVASAGVQRNPYHPPQMEGSEGLERGTCPTSLLQD